MRLTYGFTLILDNIIIKTQSDEKHGGQREPIDDEMRHLLRDILFISNVQDRK